MGRTMVLIPILAALALAGCSESGPENAAPAATAADSLEGAMEMAKRTNRPVLVAYLSETCPYCDQMEEATLSAPEVKKSMERVIFFRAVKGESAASFEKSWGTPPTPSFVVLRPDGAEMGAMKSGVIAKSDFLSYLDWAASGSGAMPVFRTGGG